MWINSSKILSSEIPNILPNMNSIGNGLFLDLYPNARIAYSVRKLRTAYSGFCMQIRRSSDNSTLNVGFVNNYVDTNAITTFCGTGQGFVTIFYDQSGNGNNAIQNTAVSQPRIYNNGLNLVNGLLSLFFDGTNDYLQFTTINANVSWQNLMIDKRQSLSFPSISGSAVQGGLSPHFGYVRADNRWTFTVGNAVTTNYARTYTSSATTFTSLNLTSKLTTSQVSGSGSGQVIGSFYINNTFLSGVITPTNSTITYINISTLGVERTTYGYGNLSENVLYVGSPSSNLLNATSNQISYFNIV